MPAPASPAADLARAAWRATPAGYGLKLVPGYQLRRHTAAISRAYVACMSKPGQRLIINCPNQTGKTLTGSILGPLWILDQWPKLRVMLVTHGIQFATKWGRAVRNIAAENEASLRLRIVGGRDAMASDWSTTEGGGMFSTSIDRVAGYPADRIMIDDPYAGWREAHSETVRESVWDSWQTDVQGRIRPDHPASVCLIMTRYHADDLTGRLTDPKRNPEASRWKVLRLPALAEDADDPLGRKEGETLDPVAMPLEEILSKKATTSSYFWAGMHQQRPSPAGGGIVKRSWWKWYTMRPGIARFDDIIHCMPGDTKVFTATGPKRIDAVKLGDEVWSWNEVENRFQLSPVWKAECSGTDEILRIETRSRTLRPNASHRVLVRRKFAAPRPGPGGYKGVEWRNVWVQAGDVSTEDYLIGVRELPPQAGDVAPNGRALTEDFMAFMGLYVGDGCMSDNTVKITLHDEAPYKETYRAIAQREFRSVGDRGRNRTPVDPTALCPKCGRLAKWGSRPVRGYCGSCYATLRQAGELPAYEAPERQVVCADGPYRMAFGSVSAVKELRDLGFAGKAPTKRVPGWVFGLRPSLILAFLRGYLDSDGAVNERGLITYSSVNPDLLEDVRHLCMLVGVPISRVARYATAGQVVVMGRSVMRRDMYQVFANNAEANRRIGAHHPGKQAHLDAAPRPSKVHTWAAAWSGTGTPAARPGETFDIPGAAALRVLRIVREPAEPVFDLGVEGTHSFIADGVVVHNSWDMAFKETATSSFVVGQVWGRIGGDFYLLDQVRDRMDFPSTLVAVELLAAKWPMARAKLVEDKANGPAVIATLARRVPGLIAVGVDGSKEARLHAVSPLIEAGNVFLPDPVLAPWIGDFVEELSAFPTGSDDDQVDACSQALDRLSAGVGVQSDYTHTGGRR